MRTPGLEEFGWTGDMSKCPASLVPTRALQQLHWGPVFYFSPICGGGKEPAFPSLPAEVWTHPQMSSCSMAGATPPPDQAATARTGFVWVMLAETGLSQPRYGEEQGKATVPALLPHSPVQTVRQSRAEFGQRVAGSPAGTEPCCRCCPGSLPASVLGTRVLKSALTTPRGWMRCQRLFGLSHMRSLLITGYQVSG